jgi:SMC interacting uncharacterized protein involved in chromosome segregation
MFWSTEVEIVGFYLQLKEEIHSLEMTIATSRDEKGHLEEKLSTVQASNLVAQDENKSLRVRFRHRHPCRSICCLD